jgi:PIN domain nuclease of toxin-antitoxin system
MTSINWHPRAVVTWRREASAPGLVVLHPLDVEVVVALDQLPTNFHGDPADRLIVATALAHRLHLATQDRAIRSSGIISTWEKSG